MPDLKTLGILSGISQGALKGLQSLREQNRYEEEKAEEQREEKEKQLKESLTYWSRSKEEAKQYMDLFGVPQDQQKLLEPIIGIYAKTPQKDIPAAITQFENLLQESRPGWTPERAYNMAKMMIANEPNLTDTQRAIYLDSAAQRFGYSIPKKPADQLSAFDKQAIYRRWYKSTPDGKKELEAVYPMAPYWGEPPKPERPERPDRTPEEILRDQKDEIRERIRDVDDNVDSLRKAIPEAEGATKARMQEQLKQEMRKRNILIQKRSAIRNRQKPMTAEEFQEFIKIPEEIQKKLNTRERIKKAGLPRKVADTMLRKKATQWLRKNAPGYELTEANIQAVIKKGLVK